MKQPLLSGIGDIARASGGKDKACNNKEHQSLHNILLKKGYLSRPVPHLT